MESNYGYDQGYQDGKNKAKSDKATKEAIDGFMGFSGSILGTIIGILFAAILYSGALILAYMLCKALGIADVKSTGTKILILLSAAYLVLCSLYFLKGLLVSLKARNNQLWIILWIVCFLIICVLPAYTLQIIMSGLVKNLIVTWAIAVIAGLIIYFYYKLTVDSSPLLTKWSYQLGKKAGS